MIHHGRVDLHEEVRWIAARTNHRGLTGSLGEALVGVDVFIGVSAPDLLTQADIEAMAPGAIVSAGANPVSGFEPEIAAMDAAVVATGRSDLANQINNVLAFRWVSRGLLDAHSHRVTDDIAPRGRSRPLRRRHARGAQRDVHRSERRQPHRDHRGRPGRAGRRRSRSSPRPPADGDGRTLRGTGALCSSHIPEGDDE